VSRETGGPAFPLLARCDSEGNWDSCSQFTGLTVRDYFAARAPMPPPKDFLRDFGRIESGEQDSCGQPVEVTTGEPETSSQYFARWSMHYADTMLAERLK